MRSIRTLLCAVLLVLGTAACQDAPQPEEVTDEGGAATPADRGEAGEQSDEHPVGLPGIVNDHGEEDLGDQNAVQVDYHVDDNYFEPTFVHVAPGATVTASLTNDGEAAHTFTIDDLGVDVELQPGDSEEVQVDLPDEDGAWRFYCRFHAAGGMQGAFFTEPGQEAAGS